MLSDDGGVFGDPLQELYIANKVVNVEYYGGSSEKWAYTYKWRFQENDWYLIGATNTTMSPFDNILEKYDLISIQELQSILSCRISKKMKVSRLSSQKQKDSTRAKTASQVKKLSFWSKYDVLGYLFLIWTNKEYLNAPGILY